MTVTVTGSAAHLCGGVKRDGTRGVDSTVARNGRRDACGGFRDAPGAVQHDLFTSGERAHRLKRRCGEALSPSSGSSSSLHSGSERTTRPRAHGRPRSSARSLERVEGVDAAPRSPARRLTNFGLRSAGPTRPPRSPPRPLGVAIAGTSGSDRAPGVARGDPELPLPAT
ncbi:unnamed protein product [Lampetra planeri]